MSGSNETVTNTHLARVHTTAASLRMVNESEQMATVRTPRRSSSGALRMLVNNAIVWAALLTPVASISPMPYSLSII